MGQLRQRLEALMEDHIYPSEQPYYEQLQSGNRTKSATLALYLASSESSYVTGQVLVVDGGATA